MLECVRVLVLVFNIRWYGRYSVDYFVLCLVVVLHEGIHFVKQLAPFQGIVRPTRKYQKPGDKTPFFLANDIVTHRPVSKRPPLTEQQKSDLRQSLLKAGLNPTIIC